MCMVVFVTQYNTLMIRNTQRDDASEFGMHQLLVTNKGMSAGSAQRKPL